MDAWSVGLSFYMTTKHIWQIIIKSVNIKQNIKPQIKQTSKNTISLLTVNFNIFVLDISTEILPLTASCVLNKRKAFSIIVYDAWNNNFLSAYGSLQRSKDRTTCEQMVQDSAHRPHVLLSATFWPLWHCWKKMHAETLHTLQTLFSLYFSISSNGNLTEYNQHSHIKIQI